jgi:hypothetical protein
LQCVQYAKCRHGMTAAALKIVHRD